MNKKYLEKALYSLLVLGMLGILQVVYIETHKEEIKEQKQLAALFQPELDVYIKERTKEADCVAQGPLPDSDCTPGDIFPEATVEKICVSGYSKTVRNVSVSLKKKVFAEYGVNYPVSFGSYEVDHLIPLSLGGSNDIANLWPKSAEPWPGFYEKDITGNYLLQEVCRGNINLSMAQKRIAQDWFLIYNNIKEEDIRELKNKYKNWADR